MFEANLSISKKAFKSGPGPTALVYGTTDLGYYGTLASTDFLTLAQLRTLTGFTGGTDNTAWDGRWIKMAVNSKVLFIPSVYLASAVSRNALLAQNLIFGKSIVNNGYTFSARVAKISDGVQTAISANTQNIDRNRLEWANSEWGKIVSALLTPAQDTDWPHWLLFDRTAFLVPGPSLYFNVQEVRTGASTTSVVVNNNLGSFTSFSDAAAGSKWLPILEFVS